MPETQLSALGNDETIPAPPLISSRVVSWVLVKHILLVVSGYTSLFVIFFAPVLFSGRTLAPGDGILYFLPNFAAPRVLWDLTIWGGFPAVGDSQLMLWYPPALLFSVLGVGGYQPFVLAAYVLASSFTYGYILTLTQSRMAAAVSGIIYGLSAFMIVHIGHVALIHAAAWLPLLIWALTMLQRARIKRLWFIIATFAVACAALSGHPQIFAYSLVVSVAFALVTGWQAACGRWRYYGVCTVVIALGLGLAALQLWPTAELTRLSWRAALDFNDFTAYALPLRQIPVFLFPLLYGGAPGSFYGTAYFGAWPSSPDGWGAGELSGYVGLLSLMLAIVGFLFHRRDRTSQFWLVVCIIAFLLTLGPATPLARLTFLLPVVNKFRAPARHFLELTFGVSVLAGLGVKAIQRHEIKPDLIRSVVIGFGLFLFGCWLSLFLLHRKIDELSLQRIERTISLKPWSNPAIGVPLLLFFIVGAGLLFWHRQPHSVTRSFVLLLALIIDLAAFSWFYEWHYRAPYKAWTQPPIAALNYQSELTNTHQRILPIRGGTGRVAELPPNLSKLWDIESASGYGPFILSRLSQMLTMPPHGSVDESWRDPANQGLDLMAVRYALVPPEEVQPPFTTDEQGRRWSASEFNVQLGTGCDPKNPTDFRLDLPTSMRATQIGIVSALACSETLVDGQQFATLVVTDTDEQKFTLNLSAGHESSEWAYDCADVRPSLRQARAPVFRSYPVVRGEVKCEGHDYLAGLPLPQPTTIKQIELRWIAPAGTVALKKISLLDETTHASMPINPVTGSLEDSTRWRRLGEIGAANSGYPATIKSEDTGRAVVFENLRARPRVWLAPHVATVSAADALAAVRSSRLPDGRVFDPGQLALVEEQLNMQSRMDQPAQVTAPLVKVTQLAPRWMEVRVTTSAPAFLVTSDIFYPGWRATVDSGPAKIYRTDYALRGVPVPAGSHAVRFEFRPTSFYYGLIISAICLILLIGCVFYLPRLLPR